MNWWRAHHGISNDSKLAVCAQRAKARRCEVLAVWVALLDFASQNEDDRGSICGLDQDQIAAITDIKLSCVESIMNEFKRRGMVTSEGRLTAWDKRQPRREREDSDSATDRDRQRRFRQKLKEGGPTDSLNYMRHFPVVFERDGGCCVYCGDSDRDLLGLDHGVPRCMGGDDDVMNLYLSCRKCNSSKGGRTPDESRFPFKNHEAAKLFEENKSRLSRLKLAVTPELSVTPSNAQIRLDESREENTLKTRDASIAVECVGGEPPTPKKRKRRKINPEWTEAEKALGERLPWFRKCFEKYPTQRCELDAMVAFERKVRDRELALLVYEKIKQFAAWCERHPTRSIKYMNGWIDAERWREDFTESADLIPRNGVPPAVATISDRRRSETVAGLDAIDKILGRA